jgi:hypothetical protein
MRRLLSAMSVAVIVLGTVIALADGYTVDNDTFASGNQNIVNLTVAPGATASTSGQIVVSYSGNAAAKHLHPNQTVQFAVVPAQTTLPVGYTVGNAEVAIGSTWGTGSTATGSSAISFTAPATAGSYSYVVKWDPVAPSCTAGNGQCLSGAAALNINLTVSGPSNTAPTLTLNNVGPVEGNTLGGATVSFSNSASDTQDGNLTSSIVCDASEATVFPVGTTTVNCSVTDSGNLTTSGSFTVTVVDTTPPVVTTGGNVSSGPTGAFGASVSYGAASATDIVDGALTPTCTPASGSAFGFGNTTVTCSATDAAGNRGSATFTVTVNGFTIEGFFSPISMVATNSVKGGSTVPVKFRLRGEGGMLITDTAAVSSIKIQEYSCSTTDMIGNETTPQSTNGLGLRYDADGTQFIYNWKVPAPALKCYTLTVLFTDGASRSARFSTK